MANSQNSAVPKNASQQTDTVIDIPNEWREIQFQDLFANGWKPRIKTQKGISYITLRRGNNEKSLGPYTEERWQLVASMLPRRELPLPISQSRTSLLTSSVAKPEALKPQIGVSLETLQWYQWVQSKGYDRSLGDFVNEVVHDYFREQGIELAVIIQKGETQNGS